MLVLLLWKNTIVCSLEQDEKGNACNKLNKNKEGSQSGGQPDNSTFGIDTDLTNDSKMVCMLNLELCSLIEKVHLDDLDLYVVTFCCVSNVSLTLITSIETY